ncbi:MAG: hypothetical protein K6F42_00125 [Bacteroidales bacterium]|nr:hypothetical protein [Bacteroidales bacterium]
MKEYLREQQRQEKAARRTGVFLTAALHAVGLVLVATSGLKYLDPPPPETTFLMDFTEEEEIVENRPDYTGTEPRSEEVDLTRPLEIVQRSESPVESRTANTTPATAPDPHGDVEVPPTPEEPKLDPRAAFPGMAKKDTSTTAPHSAAEAGEGFKAGQPTGNTDTGRTDGTPNAHLKGRTVKGSLPRPAYNVQLSGIVVVQIWVDPYGNVQRALPGADGTTVTDATLWAAARKAALESHFNQSGDAPALQEGTITYIFKLK